jgi:hypothetical protein
MGSGGFLCGGPLLSDCIFNEVPRGPIAVLFGCSRPPPLSRSRLRPDSETAGAPSFRQNQIEFLNENNSTRNHLAVHADFDVCRMTSLQETERLAHD